MGLFDRKKKEASVEAKEVQEEKVVEAKKDFTLVVEVFRLIDDDKGSIVGGTVHGTVKEGQTVFVIPPSGAVFRTDVARIEIGPDNAVESATDTRVALFLPGINRIDQIPKYAVISSTRPGKDGEVAENELKANPQFLGLSMEFPKYSGDNQYMSFFAYILCHTDFITPINKNDVPTADANGSVNFYLINNSADPDKQYLPLFTSVDILSDWKGLMEEEPKTLKMSFQDVVKVTENMDGAVINPFGPMPVPVPKEFIENIISMEGYKREFGDN